MKKFLCALLLMTAAVGGGKVLAQKYKGDIWCFGDSVGIDWSSPTSPTFFMTANKGRSGTATLSDSTNALKFYAAYNKSINQIRYVFYNKYHKMMSNGDTIFGDDGYHSIITIPNSQNDSLLYVFTIGIVGIVPYGLHYSIINYKANNDSGIVIQKNIQLRYEPAFDGLTAVRHGNGRDWWLIFKKWDNVSFTPSNSFYIYKIDQSGIVLDSVQNIGPFHTTGGGAALFNSTGNLFYFIDWRGAIFKYDFDRCNGLFSNPLIIEPERLQGPYPYYFSCALSSDETKLYVTSYAHANPGSLDTLYQYDLTAANIGSTRTPVYTLPNSSIGMGMLKLAPDNKIYLAGMDENFWYPYPDTAYTQYNTHLSVINQPDSLGLACDFQPFSFYLGGARTYFGLPNNPDYELGAWVGSPCDTLSVGVDDFQPPQQVFFQAWYNSEWNMIHVNASKLKGRTGSLRLFDIEGRLVYEKKMEVIAGGYVTGEIPMNAVANGVYFVNLITDSESVSSKTIKF
ncbi:MAG: T9SS type A sorting domain-containing protein [Bacteroidetes bacterium]|nr:T9SS type A sorting domain-containing protein [Bacteroidota bacterium]